MAEFYGILIMYKNKDILVARLLFITNSMEINITYC